jgi:hypothetical protein
MDMPKTVKIGGHDVEVVFSEWSVDRMGASHTPPGKIYINTACCKSQQEATLLHEILEHINDACDLSLAHGQISVLEAMLYQVLVDNELRFGGEGENSAKRRKTV